MGYNDDYEYDDDEEYYEDDEEYIDYDKDDTLSSRLGGSVKPYSGAKRGGGLPGSSSSGSRFGGSSGASRLGGTSGGSSRFSRGSSDDSDDDDESTSKFRGTSSSRFGGTSGGSSRFGGTSGGSSRFSRGSSDDSDDDDESTSKFRGTSSNRFGGTSGGSSRFGSSKKEDDKGDKKGSSRFGSSPSSGSRFGGSSGGSSSFSSGKKDDDKKGSSRFGGTSGGSSRFGSSKKEDDKGDKKGSSRFGGASSSSSRFGSSPSTGSRFGDSKKEDGKGSKKGSSRFGAQKAGGKQDSKADDKDSGGGIGGLVGGFRSRLGGSDDKKADDKDSSGGIGGLVGGFRSRLGGSDDKKADDKDSGGGGLGGLVGGFRNRLGGGGDDKKDDKKPAGGTGSRFGSSSSSSTGSRFGGASTSKRESQRLGGPSKAGSSRFGAQKADDKKSSSRFGSKKDDSKKDDSKSSGGSRFGAIGSRFGGGKKDDKKADKKDSGKKPSPFGKKLGSKDDKKASGRKSGRTVSASAQAQSGGVRGRLTSAVGGFFTGGRAGEEKQQVRRVPKTSDDGLTLDNWLDIIGVAMVFFSLIMFFSAISQEQAAISALHTFTGQLFGWGALAAPVTLFLVGMWLIIRHFGEDAPTVDPIRVIGVVIIYFSALVVFQYVEAWNYAMPQEVNSVELLHDFLRLRLDQSVAQQAGGGWVGAELYFLLVMTFTEIGGFLLVLFALMIGAMLLTRMSAAEIVRASGGMWLSFREYTKQRAVRKRAERQLAAQQAAQESLMGGQQLQTQSVGATQAQIDPQTAGREIRMTVGGQAQTIAMQQQYPAQAPQQMPVQTRQPVAQSSGSNGGLFSRFLGSNGGNSTTSSPPPPTKLPDTPLPMDDGFSHFDTGPMRATKTESPQRLGDMLRAAPQQATPPPSMPETPAAQPTASQQQAAANVGHNMAEEEQEVNDFLKQRQDRLNALRQGEVGPLSQGALARARQEDIQSAFVPSSEGQRDEQYSKFQTGVGAAAKAEATHAGDGSSKEFVRPSQLPSVQPDGDNEPRQQMLAVGVDEPVSSEVKSSRAQTNWRLPDYHTLLSSGGDQEFDREYLLKQAKTIEDTLESFGAPGRVVEVNTGPVITQFGVEPDYIQGRGRKQRVKVSSIATLDKDIQLALGARSIRVEAPVPGKGYVGIEVPNAESALVSLRDVMDSQSFAKHGSPLTIALGQSVSGAPISADLSTMPHLLIAGTTGSGKSVCVNSIIASILALNTPDQVKFIMVDPKRVELTGYNGIPHLVAPVVVELERIIGVLKWVTREMDTRYKRFSDAGARNIEDYNKHRNPETTEAMPYLVVIIDELADLMMLAPEETERTITRIAALARATGIHLVIATQRPSVDVVTGLIKANFPARIAFAVAGSVDSRVILDQPGAERLLGKGDMLWMSGDSPAPLRLQGVFVSDMEINNIVRYWKMQALKNPSETQSVSTLAPKFSSEESKSAPKRGNAGGNQAFWDNSSDPEDLPLFAAAKRNATAQEDSDASLTENELTGDVEDGNEDDLYERAVELVRRLDKASISLLQRRLRIGYTRAARLIDVMEARGVVGPSKDGSSKPRDVLPEN